MSYSDWGIDAYVISQSHYLVKFQSKMDAIGTSSTVWLTKAVDTSVSYPVHVVVYTVPSLRRPPVLLVQRGAIRRGKITGMIANERLAEKPKTFTR